MESLGSLFPPGTGEGSFSLVASQSRAEKREILTHEIARIDISKIVGFKSYICRARLIRLLNAEIHRISSTSPRYDSPAKHGFARHIAFRDMRLELWIVCFREDKFA